MSTVDSKAGKEFWGLKSRPQGNFVCIPVVSSTPECRGLGQFRGLGRV